MEKVTIIYHDVIEYIKTFYDTSKENPQFSYSNYISNI